MTDFEREAGMGRRGCVSTRMIVGFVTAGMLLAGLGARAAASARQQRPTSAGASRTALPVDSSSGPGNQLDSRDVFQQRLEEKRIASEATERHTRMAADAEKLLMLASELKKDVDASGKDEMSVATVRKAAEIEKLAHDVKERMKGQ